MAGSNLNLATRGVRYTLTVSHRPLHATLAADFMGIMTNIELGFWLLLLATLLCPCSAVLTETLDDFTMAQTRLSTFAAASLWNAVTDNSTIVGGEREMILVKTRPSPTWNYVEVSGGAMQTSEFDGIGNYTMQYDGPDNSPDLDVTGLGGLDFTKHGASTLSFDAYVWTYATVSIFVYSPDGSKCSWADSIPMGVQNVKFSSFTGDCDWTNVGAMEFVQTIENDSALTVYWLQIS